MKNVLLIVQDERYVRTNCYIHQLVATLEKQHRVSFIGMNDLSRAGNVEAVRHADSIVVLLQQRKVDTGIQSIVRLLGDTPIVIYDQDPWENFRDDSRSKGSYLRCMNELNVARFVVTSRFWAHRMESLGMPVRFERIWVLPEYCDVGKRYEQRTHQNSFVGSMHAYRRPLFEALVRQNADVHVAPGTNDYASFMNVLSEIGTYVYSADHSFTVDGMPMTMKSSLWAKDVEAMARGCFVVREADDEYTSFIDNPMRSFVHFRSPEEAHQALVKVATMDANERYLLSRDAVEHVRDSDCWRQTADALVL
jgi:hypothetical protein